LQEERSDGSLQLREDRILIKPSLLFDQMLSGTVKELKAAW
jgi:hypothetical protein